MSGVIDKIAPFGAFIAFLAGVVLAAAYFLQDRANSSQVDRLREENKKLREDLVARADQVAALQQELLNFQTGGNSYPKVALARPINLGGASPTVQFRVYNVGMYQIPDVRIWVVDLTDVRPYIPSAAPTTEEMVEASREFFRKSISFGPDHLRVTEDRVIGAMLIRETDHLRYRITFQSGLRQWTQQLSYRLVGEVWLEASRVYGPGLKLLGTEIDPEYPRDANGDPRW